MTFSALALTRSLGAALAVAALAGTAYAASAPPKSVADIVKESKPSDWRPLDPQNTLVMELKGGEVIIELAPRFAPQHVANIRTLAREGYYGKSAIVRVQDNYVTQWADPNDEVKGKELPLGSAKPKLPVEFAVPFKGLALNKLADGDEWAPVTGFLDGMPVAANPGKDQAWLPHCYGVVGAARGTEADSSTGTSLYVIIGNAPRRLDLNITTVGRVLKGMELLS
jgi:peptidylprolyl isomerase